jgi:hypothetical protein
LLLPVQPDTSARATFVARGLLRTERASGTPSIEYEMLRLDRRGGGYYWITFEGTQLYRGRSFFRADELQPKFIDAMERAGR